MSFDRIAEDVTQFQLDNERIAGPRFGQVWTNNKTRREVFVEATDRGADLVTFQYFDTGRHCDWFWTRFVKQFTFTRIHT